MKKFLDYTCVSSFNLGNSHILTTLDSVSKMAVNVVGLVAIIIFYILVLGIGIWAGRKKKGSNSEEDFMVAGRNIGLIVGVFSTTATWVGGGFINGTAEAEFTNGLIWCQAPFGYSLSLVFGGLMFAEKMREQGYVTMLDPFQDKFGQRMGGLLFLPALLGEVFWSAAVLASLGATLSVIIDLDPNTSVIVSAAFALLYTLVGGLYSVSYTDVVQLICILGGLWLCIPFAMVNPAVKSLSHNNIDWFGEIHGWQSGQYIDSALLLIFGGIPWQDYFQRVLSSKNGKRAEMLSYIAAVGCVVVAVPSVLIGAIGKATAWNETLYHGHIPIPPEEQKLVLPLVLQYLTPTVVSFFGLGAVSAAVMSSVDSAILSTSSMFARNVYRLCFRQKASETEIIWVLRGAIIVMGVLATVTALTIPSIYGLWCLCSDFVYVVLFPQLVCVVYMPAHVNTYGSLSAYVLGMLLRLLGGEDLLRLPAVIHYPWYNVKDGQLFPFRTFAMLVSFVCLLCVTWITKWIFENKYLSVKYDVFRCIVNLPDGDVKIQDVKGVTQNESVDKNLHTKDVKAAENLAFCLTEDARKVDGDLPLSDSKDKELEAISRTRF